MGWLFSSLGYGNIGVIDLDDPSNPPRVSGYPVNKIVNFIADDITATSIYTAYYTPASGKKCKLRRIVVSGTAESRLDFLYGTNVEQTLKWRVWTSPENPSFILEFPDYLLVTSTQIIQLNLVNISSDTEDYHITFDFYED